MYFLVLWDILIERERVATEPGVNFTAFATLAVYNHTGLFVFLFLEVWRDMGKRKGGSVNKGPRNGFRFVQVKWSEGQLHAVRKWVVDYAGMGTKAISEVCERGWKLSVSQHPQTARFLATITDKFGRPGCSNCCFIVEHSVLENAVIGALYAATELFDDGVIENPMVDSIDDW